MPDRKKLLQDFYAKYAPNEQLTDERLAAIDAKYKDNDKQLLQDFYAKYAPEQKLTDERYNAITAKYGLGKQPASPSGNGGASSSAQSTPPVTPSTPSGASDPTQQEIDRLQAKYENALKTNSNWLTDEENQKLISLKKQKQGGGEVIEEKYKFQVAPFATSKQEAESQQFKEKEQAFMQGVAERTATNRAETYRMNAPNANTSLNLAELETRLSKETAKVPEGTTSVDLIGLKNEIEGKYGLLESDYLAFLESADKSRYDNYTSRLSTIKDKGEATTDDQRFLREFRNEALNIRLEADKQKVEKIKRQADLPAYQVQSDLIREEAKKLNAEYKSYFNEDGTPKSPLAQEKANAVSNRINALGERQKLVQEKTGVTDDVIAELDTAYDSLAQGEVLQKGWDVFADLTAEERKNKEDEAIKKQVAETGSPIAKSALMLMSFTDAIGSGVVSMIETPKVIADALGYGAEAGWTDYLYDVSRDLNNKAAGRLTPLESENTLMNIGDIFAKGAGNVVLFASGGEAVGAIKAGSTIMKNAGVVTSAFLMSEGQNYREALAAGISPEDAAQYATMISTAQALTETLVPDFKYFDAGTRKSILAAIKEGKGVKEAFKQYGKQLLVDVPKTGIKEVGEELVTEVTGDAIKEGINAYKDATIYKDTFNSETYANVALTAFVTGGGLASLKRGVRELTPNEESVARMVGENADAIVENIVTTQPEEGVKIGEDVASLKEMVTGLKNIPSYEKLGEREKDFVVNKLMQKRDLEESMRMVGVKDDATKAEIEKIESDINAVYNGKKVGEEYFVEDAPEKLNVGDTVVFGKPEQNIVEETPTAEVTPQESAPLPTSTKEDKYDENTKADINQAKEFLQRDIERDTKELEEYNKSSFLNKAVSSKKYINELKARKAQSEARLEQLNTNPAQYFTDRAREEASLEGEENKTAASYYEYVSERIAEQDKKVVQEAPTIESTQEDTKLVDKYRKQEQDDLVKAIPNIADFDTYGEKQGNMPNDLYAIYKPIYDKYNKLITNVGKPSTTTQEGIKEGAVEEIVPEEVLSEITQGVEQMEQPQEDVGEETKTKQQIENFGVNKADVEPVHSVISQVFNGLKKAGLTAAKTVGDWVGIGKGSLVNDALKQTTNEERNNILEQAKKDGTYLKAPNGKKSNLNEKQWLQTRTKAFKDWFGDWENDPNNSSKVVDENGEPLVVYHGTDRKIDIFNLENRKNFRENEVKGYWFTNSLQNAKTFSFKRYQDESSKPTIIEVFLNIKKPVDVDIKYINKVKTHSEVDANLSKLVERFKNDGVIKRGFKDKILSDNYVVFSSNQIKSATENVGSFSSETGNILYKDAEAQYRIESGKNIVEAIKDFNGSPRATIALTHEIMHPTVVAIIDGAKEGNEVGLKHTQTIVDEFNKANPKNQVTVEQLIEGNDAFKDGTTSKKYRAVQEFIAKSWEKYHLEGKQGFSKAFQDVLDQITKAFQSVYKSLSGKQLTPELRKMFDEILGKETIQVSGVGKYFKIDNKDTFYHASNTKRKGRLRPTTAQQFGTAVYFSTNKDLVIYEFGEEVTEIKLEIDNPVYTNTKEWYNVEKLALEKANEGKEKDEDGDIIGEETDIAEIKAKFISDAAKELGYDAIIDKGSSQYENEIGVLDESKIKYVEDVEQPQETTQAQETETQDEVQSFADEIAEETDDEAKNRRINEIAAEYLDAQGTAKYTPKQQAIYDIGLGTNAESFAEFGDRNLITIGLARAYFSKKGMGIDEIALYASNDSGLDITPDDVVDFMLEYPNGLNSRSPRAYDLAMEYKDLTGKNLTTTVAKSILKKAAKGEKVSGGAQKLIEDSYGAFRMTGIVNENNELDLDKLAEIIDDEGYFTQFPLGLTKDEYEKLKEHVKANVLRNEGESLPKLDGEVEAITQEPATEEITPLEVFDTIENAQRTKKTVKGKKEAMEEAVKEYGEVGEKAIFVESNFKDIIESLKEVKDAKGNNILKVKC